MDKYTSKILRNLCLVILLTFVAILWLEWFVIPKESDIYFHKKIVDSELRIGCSKEEVEDFLKKNNYKYVYYKSNKSYLETDSGEYVSRVFEDNIIPFILSKTVIMIITIKEGKYQNVSFNEGWTSL